MAVTCEWQVSNMERNLNESTEVQAICNAVHTEAIKTAYAAHLASQEV